MAKIGDAQFRVMCKMWGVDAAIRAAKGMGFTPAKEQIEANRQAEQRVFEKSMVVLKKEEQP